MTKRELIEPAPGYKPYARRDDKATSPTTRPTSASRPLPTSGSIRPPRPSPARAIRATAKDGPSIARISFASVASTHSRTIHRPWPPSPLP
jgi:hypothetical protein